MAKKIKTHLKKKISISLEDDIIVSVMKFEKKARCRSFSHAVDILLTEGLKTA